MVGTQADLRDDPIAIEKLQRNKQKPISTEQAERLARDLKVSSVKKQIDGSTSFSTFFLFIQTSISLLLLF